jgi:hypothetical protein
MTTTTPTHHGEDWNSDDLNIVLVEDAMDPDRWTDNPNMPESLRQSVLARRQALADYLGRTVDSVWLIGTAFCHRMGGVVPGIAGSDILYAMADHAKVDPDYFRRNAVRIRSARAMAAVDVRAVVV